MNGRRGLVVILLAAIALLASCSTGVGAPPVVTTSTAVATATPPSRATVTNSDTAPHCARLHATRTGSTDGRARNSDSRHHARRHAAPITSTQPNADPGRRSQASAGAHRQVGGASGGIAAGAGVRGYHQRLPGGCARFDHYTVERSGFTIAIAVWNTMPATDGPCTTIYGYVPHSIALGSGFQAGTYLVRANDVTTTFAVR